MTSAFIIAFAVVALAGGVLRVSTSSDELKAARRTRSRTRTRDFKKYSTKYNVVVSASNEKNLRANIDLIKAQLDPLVLTKLQSKENKLHSIEKEDPVAWKHDLDDEVHRLNAAA